MTPWALCRGEGCAAAQRARRAHHTGNCYVALLIHHTVDEPPLIANIGGHCALRGRRWQKPHAALATRVTLSTSQPFPSPKLAARAVCRTVGVSIVRKSARRAPAKMCHLMVLKPPDSPAPQAPPARPPIDCPWPVPCRPRPAETQAIGAILDSRSAENTTKKKV